MKTRLLAFLLGLSFTCALPNVSAQTSGQFNVNNNTTWFNGTNWLSGTAPTGAGSTAIINHDIGSITRHLADVTTTISVAATTSAQNFVLSPAPVNGTIALVDNTTSFTWSQARGVNVLNGQTTPGWTVSYNSGTQTLTITYATAPTAHSVTVAYASSAAATYTDYVGITEQVASTVSGTLVYRKTLSQFPTLTALGLTDGQQFFWKNGVGSSSPNFSVTYNSSTREIRVTYASNPGTGRPIIAAYFPAGIGGTADVSVGTFGSGEAIKFTRSFSTTPVQDANFKVTDGNFNWVNGTSSSPTNFTATYTPGNNTIVATYKTLTALTTIGTGRTLLATYTNATPGTQAIVLGNLFLGDISSGERMDVRLNSLTFDNNGKMSQLNNVLGAANELSGNITLNNNLTVAMRSGGDASPALVGATNLSGVNSTSFILSGTMTGSGGLTKIDSGNWTLAGNNSYAGDTFLRSTGGFTFLKNLNASNVTLTSPNIVLGNANRDGHSSMVIQLGASNQIADTSKLTFDAASGRNSYLRMQGFNETIGGLFDVTGQGVIENTESETGMSNSSILTVNTAANEKSVFNGFFRNKSSASSSGTIGLTKAGTGELTLTGNNVFYSGPSTVSGGTLRLANITGAGNLPFDPTTFTATSTGGAFSAANAPRFRSAITASAGSTVDLFATTTWTFGSSLSGAGNLSKSGVSVVNVTGNNAYTGKTIISGVGGRLQLQAGLTGFQQDAFTDFAQVADSNGNLNGNLRNVGNFGQGKLSGTSEIDLWGAALRIQNGQNRVMLQPGSTTATTTVVYNDSDRVNDAAPIVSNGGTVEMINTYVDPSTIGKIGSPQVTQVGPALNYSEVLGPLQLASGVTTVNMTRAEVGHTSKLEFATITHQAGAVVNFSGEVLGDGSGRNQLKLTNPASVPLVNGIFGGWATIQTRTVDANNVTTRSDDFATWDATTNSIRALQSYWAPAPLSGTIWTVDRKNTNTNPDNWTQVAKQNMLIDSAVTGNINLRLTTTLPIDNPQVFINSLKFDGSSGRTLTLQATGSPLGRNLVINTGGIMARGANHTLSQGTVTAGGDTGNYDLNVWSGENANRQFTINSEIADNNGHAVTLVKYGPGDMLLTNTNNSNNSNGIDPSHGYSGGTKILEGDLRLTGLGSLGRPGPLGGYQPDFLTLDGGGLVFLATTGNRTETFANTQGITVGAKGGRLSLPDGVTVPVNSAIIDAPSVATPGDLQIEASDGSTTAGGTVVLNGPNTFKGNLIATQAATLVIGGGSNMFSGMTVTNSATLQILSGAAVPATATLNAALGLVIVNDDFTVSALTGAAGNILTTGATRAVNLTVNQDINTSFGGQIADGTGVGGVNLPTIGLVKAGKGVLSMTSNASDAGNFRGRVDIQGGVLVANTLRLRGLNSSIGLGTWDSAVADGTGELSIDKRSASNFIIRDGAALSYAGDSSAFTNRAFQIGPGTLGASVLSNAPTSGSFVRWVQGALLHNSKYTDTNPLMLTGCGTTDGGTTITCSSTAELSVGMILDQDTNANVAFGTKVVSITNATSFVVDQPSTGTVTGLTLYAWDPDAGLPITGQYDDIGFTTPNQNATLNLGGRNTGTNIFGMDLHDNGTGQLSLTKTGDGQWILGELDFATLDRVTTPSRSNFTGRTTIYTGTLGIAQNGVLGAAGGESVNLVGGNLDLRDVNYTVNESLSLAGGRLRSLIGSANGWNGNISMDVFSTIEMGPTSNLALRGSISGKGGLTKIGFGTLTLGGTNTFTGGTNVSEGIVQLDYSTNAGSKLADGANVNLGGGRKGGVLDIIGGTSSITEVITSLNLGLGVNQITRSDTNSNTLISLNALENFRVAQGAVLDLGADRIAKTDRLNDAGGLMGNWMTVGKSEWATNEQNVADGFIVGLSQTAGYSNNAWNGATSNVNITSSTSITNGHANTLRFAGSTGTLTTLSGTNYIRSDGILVAPSVGNASHIITGGTILPQNNGLGGNLVIHQNAPAGALTIASTISNGPGPSIGTGEYYHGTNLYSILLESPSFALNFNGALPVGNFGTTPSGTSVVGDYIDPGTVVASVDYTTGEIFLSKSLLVALNVTLDINGLTFTGDLGAEGAQNKVRVKTGTMASIATGQNISGGDIPPGSTVTAVATDVSNPNYRIVTISQNITTIPPPVTDDVFANVVVGQMYFGLSNNRVRLPTVVQVSNLYIGMPVTGDQLEPGTSISSIDFTAGDIFLNQGRTAQIGIPITVGSTVFTGDTMVGGNVARVRVFGSVPNLKALANGQTISGGIIPVGAQVTSVALDDPNAPTFAFLTINKNMIVPAAIQDYVLFIGSRNGVAKDGAGTLVLSGNNTFLGPVTLSGGGRTAVSKLTNGGVAGPLGAGNLGAGSILIGGATFAYTGDTVTTDRGFTINEIGAVDISRTGATATFNGNLSGGNGASNGIVQKAGQGTLNLSRIGGKVATSVDPATTGFGGATNIGGYEVLNGTLQLAYNNPNSNDTSNRFAASNAVLMMGGGKLELMGLASAALEYSIDGNGSLVTNAGPSENRTQQFLGQLTVESGSSEIVVTGQTGTTTTLNLQDVNSPIQVIREPGGTVHFEENPNGGTVAITLGVPSLNKSAVIPWATYKDTSLITRPGINDFAAIQPTDSGLVNADSLDLYKIASDVSSWVGSGFTNQLITEGGGFPFSGTTPSVTTQEYGIRFFEPQTGVVNVADTLELTGGAIMMGAFVGHNSKSINSGKLTSSLYAADGRALASNETAGVTRRHQDTPLIADDATLWSYDLIIHNYDTAGALTIGSQIVDNNLTGVRTTTNVKVAEPVNLVHTGIGTTLITSNNTYTGTTMLNGGVLHVPASAPQAIPGGLGATGGISGITFNGGVLGIEAAFSRSIGPGANQVRFNGSGGFAAFVPGVVDVNFGGAAAKVLWRSADYFEGTSRFILSSPDALGTIRVLNPIDIGALPRQVDVPNGFAAIDAEIAGAINGDGGRLVKLGHGTLKLSGINTYTGGTELSDGVAIGTGEAFGSATIDIGVTDGGADTTRIAFVLNGGTLAADVNFGNHNYRGVSELIGKTSSTMLLPVAIDRRVTIAPQQGQTLTMQGGLEGSGGLTLIDGGTLALHGAGAPSFGTTSGAQGSAIDGGVIVRNGTLMVGDSMALGGATVELGDTMMTAQQKTLQSEVLVTVSRTTGGHSLDLIGGLFDERSNGNTSSSGGHGAFTFLETTSIKIDGKTYSIPGSLGTKILVNGEDDHPERNGIYVISTNVADNPDTISLVRVPEFDDEAETVYATRVYVTGDLNDNSTAHEDAGKYFYLMTDSLRVLNNCSTVSGSLYVTCNSTTSVSAGMPISGPNIPANAVVLSAVDSTTLLISLPATASGTGLTFTCGLASTFNGSVTGCDITTGKFAVSCDSTATLLPGMSISGTGIPATTQVDVVLNATTFTLTFPANATGSGLTLSTSFAPLGVSGFRIISHPIIWREESTLNPNVALLADTVGINVGNNIDINNDTFTVGTGATARTVQLPGTVTLGGAAGFTSGSARFSGNIVNRNAALTLRLTSETSTDLGVNFSGSISEQSGVLSMVKLGSGTVTLSGAMSNSGATDVTAGTLLINGTTGAGQVTVGEAKATLGGIGTVGGNTLIGEGAFLSPGDPTVDGGHGALTFGNNLTFASSSELRIGLGSDVAFDSVSVIGSLTMASDSVIQVVRSYVPTHSVTFDLLSWSSLVAPGGLADLLSLPSLAGLLSSSNNPFIWDTTSFDSDGELKIIESTNPTVHFAVKDVTVREGGVAQVRVAMELDFPASTGASVNLVLAGTAVEGLGRDYTITPNPVVFNAGDRSQEVLITINDDSFAEGTTSKPLVDTAEQAVIKIGSITGGAVKGTPATLTVNIIDNDAADFAGDTWTLRNPLPSNETLLDLATDGTTIIAVGTGGTLLSSTNGVAWSRVAVPVTDRLNAVVFGGAVGDTKFVAVGAGGRVLTSPDGVAWTIRSSAGTEMNDVIWTGSNFVAVGASSTVMTSPDGIGWSVTDAAAGTDLEGVVLGASNRLIAVGGTGVVVVSDTNGTTWLPKPSSVSVGLHSVSKSGSVLVAVGDGGTIVSSSDNGDNWSAATSGTSAKLNSVRAGGGVFVAAGANGTLLTSSTGTSGWTAQASTVTEELQMAALMGSQWVAIGRAGMIVTSPTSTTWTRQSTGLTNNFGAVASNGSAFINVGSGGAILTSPDGTTWTSRTSGTANDLNAVVASGVNAIAVGNNGTAIRSTNTGAAWAATGSTGTSQRLLGIAQRSSTVYVVVGENGTILYTSNAGTAWASSNNSSVVDHLRGVASSPSLYVAVGDNGTVLKSTTGTSWTKVTVATGASLRDVIYATPTGASSGYFVAVGTGGTVLTSPDGTTWTTQKVSGLADFTRVAAVANSVLAVAANGNAAYGKLATTGVTWTKRTPAITGTSVNLAGIAAQALTVPNVDNISARFVAVGDAGSIFTTVAKVPLKPRVFFTLTSSTLAEGASEMLEINCSPAPTVRVTVPITGTGTATKGTDYTIAASVIFEIGEATKQIPLAALGDALNEGVETATLTLGTPSPATAADLLSTAKVHTLTITNDYLTPSITTQPVSKIVLAGSNVTLNSDGVGSPVLKQQWLKAGAAVANTTTITGSTTKVLSFANIAVASGGKYQVRYSNPIKTAGVLSDADPSTATVFDPVELGVVEQLPEQLKLAKINTPLVLTANVGGTIRTTGNGLSFKWFYKADAGTFQEILATDTKFSGATTKSLTIKKMDNGTGTAGANEEGIYHCEVTLTAYGATVGTLTSTDFNARVAGLPDINPIPATSGIIITGRVGTPLSDWYPPLGYVIPRASSDVHKMPLTYTASPLPAGLTLNASTGVISGTPTAAGEFKTVKITATNPAGTTTVSACWISIQPVPSTALGTFVALAARTGAHNASPPSGTFGLGARIDLTTTVAGAFTGKLIDGTLSYPISGKLNTTSANAGTSANPTGTVVITRANKTSVTLAFSLDIGTNLLNGTLTDTAGSAVVYGWRNVWTTTNPALAVAGRHNFEATIPLAQQGDATNPTIPQGRSYASATVTATNGSVVVAGKLSDGSAIATTAPLSPLNEFLVYQSLYVAPTATAVGYPGSLMGVALIGISGNPHGIVDANALSWSKVAQLVGSTKVYQGGWASPILLSLRGDLYTAPTTGTIIMDLDTTPVINNARADFFSASESLTVPASATNTPALAGFHVNSPATFVAPTAANNPNSVTMAFTASTGLFTGSFKIIHTGFATQTIPFTGMVIPDPTTPSGVSPSGNLDGYGSGSFLMPSTTGAATKSGAVKITKL